MHGNACHATIPVGDVGSGLGAALGPVADQIAAMGDFLRGELAGRPTYPPAGPNVLRAFQAPVSQVKVLIVGQDPYPTPGHPIGLSFAVDRLVRPLPRSLANIYRELTPISGSRRQRTAT